MSLNIYPLPSARVIDERTNLNNKRVYSILEGAQDHTWQQFPSTSFNNSQIQITCNPPNPKVVINRKIYIQTVWTLSFTGNSTAGGLLQMSVPYGPNGGAGGGDQAMPNGGSSDAPRQYPFTQVCNTIQATINNDQVSQNLNQYFNGLLRYKNYIKQRDLDYSITAAKLDQAQSYADLANLARNPLGGYGDDSVEVNRGGFVGINLQHNTLTTASVILTVTEPVYLSPLIFGEGDESGLVGVNNMSLTFTLGNLARLWSHDAITNNNSLAMTANLTSAQALFEYLSPDMTQPIPEQLSWPYFEITSYPTQDSQSLVNGTSRVLTQQAVQLKAIPSRMYIFVRERDQDLSISTSDVFASITNLNVVFNNRSGIFATMSQQDLFNMSVKNGLDSNFTQFAQQVGSVVCVEFGTDLPLSPIEAPGMLGNYQLQVQVTAANMNTRRNWIPALYVVVVNEGTYSIVNQSAMHQIGVFGPQDVLNSKSLPLIPYKQSSNIYGGNFWGSVKDFFTNKLPNIAKQVAPYAKAAIQLAPLLGLGNSGGRATYPELSGMGYSGGKKQMKSRKKKGRGLIGGQMISREELKRIADDASSTESSSESSDQ